MKEGNRKVALVVYACGLCLRSFGMWQERIDNLSEKINFFVLTIANIIFFLYLYVFFENA